MNYELTDGVWTFSSDGVTYSWEEVYSQLTFAERRVLISLKCRVNSQVTGHKGFIDFKEVV